MKKFLLALLLAAIPSIASAQNVYVEGSVGFVLFPDVQTDDYTITLPGGAVFSGNAETSYDTNWAFGLEGGYQTGPWRFSLSWDFINAETDVARVEGAVNGVPISRALTDAELEGCGIGCHNAVNGFALNGYYAFGSYNIAVINAGVQPYVGLGLGFASFENLSTEFAAQFTLGADVPIGPSFYLGARYRLAYMSGPS